VDVLLRMLFLEEPPGAFAHGHVISRATAATFDESSLGEDVALWKCDIFDEDRLTWSEKVYELFGFPTGTPVARAEAVARYAEASREVLERVRTYALHRKGGFLLDAEITPQSGKNRSIRILAVPVLEEGRIVGLRGVKRPL
jgi:hypothetical protein